MTPEEKKLINLLEETLKDKSNKASSARDTHAKLHEIRFFEGQRQAFQEIYSVLQSLKRTL